MQKMPLSLLDSKVKSFSAGYILEEKDWCESIVRHLHGDVYISVDLDVLDPAVYVGDREH